MVLGKGGVQRPYLGCEELQAPRRVTRGGRGLEVGEGARKGAWRLSGYGLVAKGII